MNFVQAVSGAQREHRPLLRNLGRLSPPGWGYLTRGYSCRGTPSGAAASAPAAIPTAGSDSDAIVIEDRGDDIGLANSDSEPETHHPFTSEGIPVPEPDGLVRGLNRVQPRASSVPVHHKVPIRAGVPINP